jgi:hypothetical protein
MESLNLFFDHECSILLKEKEILFAGLINKNGKIVCGGFKHEVNLLENSTKK